MTLDVYRNVSVIDSFNIDERTLFVQKFLGENYIHAEATAREPLDITIGDYVRYNGIRYYVNTLPDVIKNATNQYVYTMTFESEYYDFAKVQYRTADGQGDFYLMSDLEGFLDLLISNMNRIAGVGVWTKGTCTQTNTEYKLLKFEAENCRSVIQKLCTEFNGEMSFNRKEISFSDERTHDTGLTFQYKAGLRNIQRKPIESGNIITRLYAFGSTRNLGSAYGKLRLELNTGGVDYIESNTATYGTIEGAVIFDDVFPRRVGTVSSVASTVLFTEAAIPFNVNTYLIDGVTAKVNFLTGNCAGYTFDIVSFNNSTKEFEIVPVTLEDGTDMPNVTLHPEATDTYVLVDITMPASYVTAAEAELLALAQDYIAKYDHPRVAYQLTPDWRYMQSHNVNLTIGDTITIADTDLGINIKVRITELAQEILYPYKYTLSLTDQVEYIGSSGAQILLGAYKEATWSAEKIAAAPTISSIAKSRRNWRDSEELRNLVFDPDGYYYSASIKPLSIETTMLAAGSKSGNFELNGVVIQPNYLNNVDKLTISAGTLTHFAIDSSGADNIGTWTLAANTTYAAGGLTTGTAYYLYAKCNKTNYTDAANQIFVSSTAYQADQTTYWYFLVGVLHSTTGVVPRGLSLSYGQSLINGGHISTGTISAIKIQTAGSGGRIVLDPTSGVGLEMYNASNELRFYIRSGGTDDGDVVIGTTGNYCKWDNSAGTFTIRGLLTASDIQAGGTSTGSTLQTASSGKRVVVAVADNTLRFHTATTSDVILMDDTIEGNRAGIKITDTTNGGMIQIYKGASLLTRLYEYGLNIQSNIATTPIIVNSTGSSLLISLFNTSSMFSVSNTGVVTCAGGYVDGSNIGTDNAGTAVIKNAAISGGIIYNVTTITPAADGTYANPTSITISGGHITAIS